MYYSFLEPVKVMTNNVVKSSLPKLRDQFNLLTFEQFSKNGVEVPEVAGKKVKVASGAV